ncbi:MAG: cytidine deaminase [Prevotella sp.]|jgi:cytidine deaminase
MKDKKLEIEYQELSFDELSPKEQQLVNQAIKATDNSYSPYSHFHVGAALRLADDSIQTGANQENAAFPSGLCAERTAIFAAQAQHPDQRPVQLAIAARNDNGMLPQPVTPCGACRQVMLQMEQRYGQPLSVLLYGKERILRFKTASNLIPFSFGDEDMKQ